MNKWVTICAQTLTGDRRCTEHLGRSDISENFILQWVMENLPPPETANRPQALIQLLVGQLWRPGACFWVHTTTPLYVDPGLYWGDSQTAFSFLCILNLWIFHLRQGLQTEMIIGANGGGGGVGLVTKSCPTLVTPWTVVCCPWDFPVKNIGMGCNFLFQDIFLT